MRLAATGLLPLSGGAVEYRHTGPQPADAPVLVLLHEGLGCAALWRDFPETLAAATGCGVFAYSRYGYGGSAPCELPRPLDYMEREGEDVLPELLDAIGFARGLLVGHSDGASIAAIHGGAHADPRVAGLVLMAPHFFTEPDGLASIRAARRAFEKGDLRAKLAKYHGANVDTAFRGWNGAWLDPGFEAWNIERYLPRIAVPVLAIQGADDEYGTEAQLEALERGCAAPVEIALLDDCRHAPFLEQPEATLARIRDFVARCLA
jgi:pimeloyl-ACP methyl ester carboxylesterase